MPMFYTPFGFLIEDTIKLTMIKVCFQINSLWTPLWGWCISFWCFCLKKKLSPTANLC